MTSPFHLAAPAKINLSLRVLHRREDGYHEIQTEMVRLPGLADSLRFEPAETFSFACDSTDLPSDEENLVVRAVRAFEQSTGLAAGCRIRLEKRIPHGAGLGGGSSDAASTLLGLNRLHGSPLSFAALSAAAARIGSDVAFFLGEGPARCSGRGEICQPAPELPALDLLLLKPAFPVATADAYHFTATGGLWDPLCAPREIKGLTLVNDLEAPVFTKYLYLAEIKQWLLGRDEVQAALMAGSGSTVFAVLQPGTDGDLLARAARDEIVPYLWHWSGRS